MKIFGWPVFIKKIPCSFMLYIGTLAVINAAEVRAADVRNDVVTAQVLETGVSKAPVHGPDKRDEVINDLLRRVEELEKKIRSLQGESDKVFPPLEAALAPSPDKGKGVEEERIAQAALERTLIERSGLLLPPGTLEIEPSLTYVHASADNISIDGVSIESTLVIGEIISDRVRRNLLMPALTLRAGLPSDFQAEARIPLRYESERTVRGDTTERTVEEFGVGDVELALSHQLIREKGWIPDILGSVRWKSDTGRGPFSLQDDELALGTGYHALQFMLTAVKVKEPAAVFGSLLYTMNLPVSTPQGRLVPGDTYGVNLGLALALNLDTSINFVWEQRFIEGSEINGSKIPGSTLFPGNLRIGATYTFTPTVSLDVSVAIGLTRDAPDVQTIVAIPIRFPQFFSLGNR